jgi:hypothetical protein
MRKATLDLQLFVPSNPRGKTMLKKIKDGNPSIKSTRQMITQVDITQRKNESKQSTKIR